MPTKDSLEQQKGFIGYYTVENNIIQMEFFLPNSGKRDWDYFKMSGIIDGLVIRVKPEDAKEYFDYVLIKIDGISGTPNW